MKLQISYLYLLGILGWIIVRVLRYNEIYLPIINDYLTDLYSIPMICYTIQSIAGYIYKTKIELSFRFILFITLNVSILFEFISPHFSKIHTGDIFDVLAYFTGATIYYFLRKNHLKFTKPNEQQISHRDNL